MTPQPPEQPRTPHPEDYCGRCGGRNPSWHAASPLWNAVMRTGDQEPFDGIICPNCFAEMAAEQGVTWHICVTTHVEGVDLPTVSPGGRLWDRDKCMWIEAEAAAPDPVGQLRAALSLARSMILTGEPISPQAAAVFDEAFADAAKLLDIVEEYSRWAEVAERATAGGWTVHIGTRATCQEHIAAGDDKATEPLTAAAFGLDVDALREAAMRVEAGYIVRPDRTALGFWQKVGAAYAREAARR